MAKILIVDDSPTIARVLERHLVKAGHDVDSAGDGKAALAKVADFRPDLITLDVMMPVMSGYQVCRAIKNNPKYAHIFILMLTGKRKSVDDEIQGLEVGADDFMTKPFVTDVLLAHIKKGVRAAEEKRNAAFDSVTGLYNQQSFNAYLPWSKAKMTLEDTTLALAVLGIDGFKAINDRLGREAGDALLLEVGTLVRAACRPTDFPARMAGAEFAMLLQKSDLETGIRLAEQLREQVAGHTFAGDVKLTISLGVASTNDPEFDLVGVTSEAMHLAQKGGGNRSESFILGSKV